MINLRINAQIKWCEKESINRMKSHLDTYSVGKKIALKEIFGGVTEEQIRNTEIGIKCGTSPSQSHYVFIKGAGNTSQLSGYCASNRLDHLLEDFDHLINQMQLSEINFKSYDIHIRTNDEKLVKKSARNYIFKRSVLTDLVTMTGIIPLISTLLLLNTNVLTDFIMVFLNAVYPMTVGLIFWLATSYIGYRSEPEYVLKR